MLTVRQLKILLEVLEQLSTAISYSYSPCDVVLRPPNNVSLEEVHELIKTLETKEVDLKLLKECYNNA